ncbi:hypothetical protein EYC84_006170 [Monilinia fructicola]|uniref:Uncharacterized protein n=1 Tax=Monilinia fructicola TaxID=38448 RepID=A0A5M9K5B1_MONFR|nr:hypothetical protein EYC84_006170 [Monilinia fructicola]
MPPKSPRESVKKPAYEPAPSIEKDSAALAARNRPIKIEFSNIARANLLPLLGAGIHAVSTESSGLLCGLYGLIYSYCAARDLAAPEGKPVPLADNPTAKELIAFRKAPEFWEEALAYVGNPSIGITLAYVDDQGVALSKAEIIRQVTTYIPDNPNNYEVPVLHVLLSHLNRKYGTHYVLGHIAQGFNVQWDVKQKKWDTDFQQPTRDQDAGIGKEPVLWLYNDNSESIDLSLHQIEGTPELAGHWMGLSTLHRDLDRYLIELTNDWFGDAVDAYLAKGVWIVTTDIEGYQVDLEDHQDPRELQLHAGCFITEPKVDPPRDAKGIPVKDAPEVEWVAPGDAPVGYMWAQSGPLVNGAELPGKIGIVPLQRVKRIEKDCLRKAHDAAGATATNIVKKAAVSKEDDGEWTEFVIHRTIEPTSKVNRKYANPNNADKKFVGGFTFEDGEFLLDTQEPLKDLYPRMIKMDGTSGRVKPRNLQALENAWGISNRIPVEPSGLKKSSAALQTSGGKTSSKYQYKSGMNQKDFTIKNLRLHCQARGYVAKEYGRTKQSMLDLLVRHDEGKGKQNKGLPKGEPKYGLPMRRVLRDIPKSAGPPKTPPFFEREIVMEIGKGNVDDPAIWVTDYEGRGMESLPKKQKKPALKEPAPKAKTPDTKAPDPKAKIPDTKTADPKAKAPGTKETGKKRPATEPAGSEFKKPKIDTPSKAKKVESAASDPFKKANADATAAAPPATKVATVPKKTPTKKATSNKSPAKKASI